MMTLLQRSRPVVIRSCLAWLGLALVCCHANAQPGPLQSTIESDAFAKRFQAYIERTEGRPIGTLNAYLASAIEDAFLDPSQVSQKSLVAEIRHFQDVLLADLKAQLCGQTLSAVPPTAELKVIIVRSTFNAARASSVEVSAGTTGRITGIVANIVRQTVLDGFCQSAAFSDLE